MIFFWRRDVLAEQVPRVKWIVLIYPIKLADALASRQNQFFLSLAESHATVQSFSPFGKLRLSAG